MQSHSQQLKQQGFTVLRSALPEQLIASLINQRDAILDNLPTNHRQTYVSQGSLVNFGDYPQFAELIARPQFKQVMQDLGFASSVWLAGYLISKPAASPALFWHQDWWGWDHPMSYGDKLPGLGLMIYLTDTFVSNGCLRVIPGSHRHWHSLHDLPVAHEASLSAIDDTNNIAYQADSDEAGVAVKAGDLVIVDPRLLHSAYPNQSAHERSLITLWYVPDYQALPESIQARYLQIFNRHDVDTGDAAGGGLLDSWPEAAKQQLKNFVPAYAGDELPLAINRRPDQRRMNDSKSFRGS